MNPFELCPCCSGKTYDQCCKMPHTSLKNAKSAEVLMRSRYSAFVLQNADYLMISTHKSQQKYHSKEDYLEWAVQNEWVKLEIIKADHASVEFKAWYLNQDKVLCVHHEQSRFLQDNEIWFYVDGSFL